MYNSTKSFSALEEVSGHLHTSGALTPGKVPLIPTEDVAG